MLIIKTLDVEINKNGKSYLISDNSITGASLEVLSFMSSGIKKRSGSSTSDGRPGRINYYSEDEYRTITITVEATAEDMQDIAHLRDAVNELFDGEMFIREMRVKDIKIEYERPGERTGELQLDSPEYVNGKQIKATMVNSPEIDDTALVSTFTVEFETTELPYFETIYTTLELHDSGYSATAEKYGLVDNIDDEKVQYRFEPGLKKVTLKASYFEQGSIASSSGANVANASEIRTVSHFDILPGETYIFKDSINGDNINYWWLFEYDKNGGYIGFSSTPVGGNGELKFVAKGHRLRVRSSSYNGIKPADVGTQTLPTLEGIDSTNNFTVYNAGNVTVEPESMFLHIFVASTTGDSITITNNTTGESFALNRKMSARHIQVNGMVVTDGTTQVFRDTNKRFISLAPGDNKITVTGATFNEIRFNFKYYYK